MMSHVVVIATTDNADHNSVEDVADAIRDCDAQDVHIGNEGVIDATVNSRYLGDIAAMDGVGCIRVDMSYVSSREGAD